MPHPKGEVPCYVLRSPLATPRPRLSKQVLKSWSPCNESQAHFTPKFTTDNKLSSEHSFPKVRRTFSLLATPHRAVTNYIWAGGPNPRTRPTCNFLMKNSVNPISRSSASAYSKNSHNAPIFASDELNQFSSSRYAHPFSPKLIEYCISILQITQNIV
jgi:hypothetical protein